MIYPRALTFVMYLKSICLVYETFVIYINQQLKCVLEEVEFTVMLLMLVWGHPLLHVLMKRRNLMSLLLFLHQGCN